MEKKKKTKLKNIVIPFKVSPIMERKIKTGAKKYTEDNNRSEFIRNCVEYFLDEEDSTREGSRSWH